MMLLYPRLLAIHDLADDVGFPASNGRLKTGRFMRASYNWMVSDGAYLMSETFLCLSSSKHRADNSQRRDRYDLVRLGSFASDH
jgi:protein transport protein SEC24